MASTTAGAINTSALRRILTAVVGMLLLTACQVDVVVDVTVEPDGTGSMTVTVTADAELVERVPTIADDLVLDDIAEAGWVIDGPTDTPDGGLVLTFTHPFSGADEATNLLRSLGPPFNDPRLGRGSAGDVTTNTLTGNFGLPDGFATFADSDLISAVGDVPFAAEFTASGATPENSMTAVIRATLPGEIVDDETNAVELDDGRLEWTIPLGDGAITEVRGRTEQAPSAGGSWARPLSIVALIALIAWVVFMVAFIGFVTFARWRRSRGYRRRPL
ncbi:hypothetical protein [Ilumatobacter coccineus]|uniref:DUF3153 domain-containing protein n=1 Tax=Ilumatobacter coccineus (strain NBRC 103263 / KCTC 29153 / YM16-304) TaxID=1313172 RepID=A0A6C7EB94_ILUCY|nr:hypothetical protein [Ilumatobacter coccineus]BAN04017.1 hypothetical protein YM304_37030 [Ilumatobacter coccineus YM16-304]